MTASVTPNHSMQRTALRAAADADRYAAHKSRRVLVIAGYGVVIATAHYSARWESTCACRVPCRVWANPSSLREGERVKGVSIPTAARAT